MGPVSSEHLFGACVPGSVLGSGVAAGELGRHGVAGAELSRGEPTGEQITSVASGWSL